MKVFFQKNRTYFILLGLFILAGGILLLNIEKPDSILFFSDNRTAFGDLFFRYATRLGEEPMYILIGLILLTKKLRHALLIGAIGFAVMGLSLALKSLFAIDRPIAFLRKNGLEDTVNLVSGVDIHSAATSFPSGHSMSGFALFSILIFLLPNKKRYIFPFFLMALSVAISRVYLVQHFWVDVYTGGLLGALLAMCFYALDLRLKGRLEKPLINLPWQKPPA